MKNIEQMNRDIEAMHAEADHLTNEDVESTRRMKKYVIESKEIASKTISVLYEQGGLL